MADTTKIEWCDSTFNPWIGCTKISPSCDNCYAETYVARFGIAEWGNHPRHRTSRSTWAKPRQWQRQAAQFYAKHGRRRRVFCASLADVFDNQIPQQWRADLWQLIRECPDIDWLILTKRPQNIEKLKPVFWNEIKGSIWLGVTCENQEQANIRLSWLMDQGDCAVRFVSIEPSLAEIDLTRVVFPSLQREHLCDPYIAYNVLRGHMIGPDDVGLTKLDWVIWGGETGPKARPYHPDWESRIRNDCVAAGVAYFRKQWGEWISWIACFECNIDWPSDWLLIDPTGTISPGVGRYPEFLKTPCAMGRAGRRNARHRLFGLEHQEFPNVGGDK